MTETGGSRPPLANILTLTLLGLLWCPPLLYADMVKIPAVGRRESGFYGAAGRAVTVENQATPTIASLGEGIEFTVIMTGVLNPEAIERPDLTSMSEYHDSFRIENLPDQPDDVDKDRRSFRYRLFPRSVDVTEIPAFWMRYFNPDRQTGSSDPTRWYEFTFPEEPIPIEVRPLPEPPASPESLRIPEFARELSPVDTTAPGTTSSWWVWATLALPPVLTVVVVRLWHRLHPDAAHWARRRQGRAARVALSELAHLNPDDPNTSTAAAEIVSRYLESRFGGLSAEPDHVREWVRLAEETQYGPASADLPRLLSEATRLIETTEENACSPS